ncbi:MAG: outer membrane lipoprotein carrier protein LolA [Gammaproteobacteria bacterium]
MKSRACLITLLSLSSVAWAAEPAPPSSFTADFVQTRTLPGFSAPLISHGDMSYDKSKGFRWEITQPYHYLFEMDGKQAHEELPDGTKRDLDPDQTPWLAAVEHIFISALSGDRSQLQSYFSVDAKAMGAGDEMTLTPKPGPIGNAIKRIEVTESAPGQPQHLEIFETSGGHMDIRFTPRGAPSTP